MPAAATTHAAMTRFISPASFIAPLYRPGGGWLGHGPFAFWLVEQLRPRLTVELGAFRGYSFAAICQALAAFKINGRAIAVDTWAGDEHGGFYDDEIHDGLKAYLDATYPGIAEMRRMRFDVALPGVADGSVDLLHVDGRHYYEDVKVDYESWRSKLSDRAVVLFHDTQVHEHGFGVWQYWSEIAPGARAFEFHHSHGLGVLAFGRDIPSAIGELLDPALPERVREDVRKAYARLGDAIEAEHAADKFRKKYEKYRHPLQHARQRLRDHLWG